MEKSSSKPTPEVKPPLAKNEVYQARKNDLNHRSVIRSLDFLTISTRPKDQFAVHHCTQFSADFKLPHDQAFLFVLKYLKRTDIQGLILKPSPKK